MTTSKEQPNKDLDDLYKEKRKCPKCGLELEPVMMYVCPRTPCPVGLGSRTVL